MTSLALSRAIRMATIFHDQQVDLGNKPYILHLMRVGTSLASEHDQAAGLLHDILEDTEATEKDMVAYGIPPEVIETVKVLTRVEGETYIEYINRVSEHPAARRVKIADLRDNLDENRPASASLMLRYTHALGLLLMAETRA